MIISVLILYYIIIIVKVISHWEMTTRYLATVSYFIMVVPKVRIKKVGKFCLEPVAPANDLSLLTVRLFTENHFRT